MLTFLKNYWYVVATAAEVTRVPLDRTICDLPVVLFRTEAGRAAMILNLCSHRRVPLSLGRLIGDTLECPYHGLRFDPQGHCVKIPGQPQISPQSHLRGFTVEERDGLVWGWMGDDPTQADPADIPAMPWRASPQWNQDIVFYYDVPAPHVLMMDNLLDLAHVAFVHRNTIGFQADELEHDPVVCEIEPTHVRTTRRMPGITPPPTVRSWGPFEGKIERTSLSEWRLPGNTFIAFSNADDRYRRTIRLDHLITPATATRHHYWVLASRDFGLHDTALTEQLRGDLDRVHQEDLQIVSAQQDMVARTPPGYQDTAIRQDRGLIAGHRIYEQHLQAQAAGAPRPSPKEAIHPAI